MQSSNQLQDMLHSINRKSYPAYKSLKGAYQFNKYVLSIDHVQGDPFASPSHISVKIFHREAGFPAEYYKDKLTRITLADYLTRQFEQQVNRYTFRAKGSGKSGLISVTRCGQEVLERTACEITEQGITVRFFVGFPANGRTINAGELEKIFFEFLPVCVEKAFVYRNLSGKDLENTIFLAEDQAYIREELKKRSLVAFVNDGAILPRESGISSKPMKGSVTFSSPESLRVTMALPHKGKITGMGIPKGITLIVGGGYHGKSTLLNALELGVYNHIQGDGREYVITDSTAQKLRSEDGRFVKDVDISLFINDLPNKKDTTCFSTEDASGSTSQAANVIEAMEAGTRAFLIDEDTSATNFMIRDELMQRVVNRDAEPIVPFIDRVEELYHTYGISTVLVAGSSGSYFHKADCIIQMNRYEPFEITESAKQAAAEFPLPKQDIAPSKQPDFDRKIKPDRMFREDNRLKMKTMGKDSISISREVIDVRYVEQLMDTEQLASLGYMLKYMQIHFFDGKHTLTQAVDALWDVLQKKGIAAVCESSYLPCGLARPRKQEVFACVNRYRRLGL